VSLALIHSRALVGIAAVEVRVEVHLAGGLPSLSIVGLPEAAVKESKDRVRAAILNAQYEFPARRITINLAPAELPKDGGRPSNPLLRRSAVPGRPCVNGYASMNVIQDCGPV